MQFFQGMYADARSRVRVGEDDCQEFEVKGVVHQGPDTQSPALHHCIGDLVMRVPL